MSNRNMIALKNAMIVVLFLITFLSSRSVLALEIKYSNVNPFNGEPFSPHEVLTLKGEITPGDYDRLLNVIWNNPQRFFRKHEGNIASPIIVLASPGGDIQDAIKIARLVKGVYAHTWVGKATGACASACFFIFASGADRMATPGFVGIHRPYVHPRRLASLSPSQAEALQNDLFRQARSYLQELQIPTGTIDNMFQRASSEVYWLSYAELTEQIGRRPPWYEQFLIGRCGLDKSIEQRYWSTGDKSSFNHIRDAENCAEWLIVPEAIGFLVNEFIKTGKNPKEVWDHFEPRK